MDKKQCLVALFLIIFSFGLSAQKNIENDKVYLLIRGDDIGSSHSANLGCIESYKNGVMQSVELMPPCPWFNEAVGLLNENPGLDVGIHLTLTSEWSGYKWKSITQCPSITDEAGNFFPMVWKNQNFPPNSSIQESDWKIEEIEQELRAQIELSLKHVPHISHVNGHMGFAGLDPKIAQLMKKLAKEYNLDVDMEKYNIQRFPGWGKVKSYEQRIDAFCENLEKLTPGVYLFVEHPAKDNFEMQAINHPGYENVAMDREWVTRVFTSPKVKQAINEKGIELISYKDLK